MPFSLRKKIFSGVGLGLTVVLILLGAVISNFVFRGVQLDLTEYRIYTIADATRELLSRLEQDVVLDFYFSDTMSEGSPQLRAYASHVRKILEDLTAINEKRLTLNIIDPVPFSEAEDQASVSGLQAVPIDRSGGKIHFGLVARTTSGPQQGSTDNIIAFFHQDRERFLEYELAQVIYHASLERSPVVGLVSNIGNPGFSFPGTPPSEEPTAFTQLERSFDLRRPLLDTPGDLDEIDLLLLVHPQNLSDTETYAIEQFLLAGGKGLIFVDPHSDLSASARNPMLGPDGASAASNLNKLFTHWGLAFDPTKVVLDARLGLPVDISRGNDIQRVRHLGILGLRRDNLHTGDIVTDNLHSINLASSGHLSLAIDSLLTLTPLLTSSDTPMLTENSRLRYLVNPREMARDFTASSERYTMAVRLSGDITSAYPEAPADTQGDAPEAEAPTTPQDQAATTDDTETAIADESAEPPKPPREHLQGGRLDAIVVADTDILSDNMWVQINRFLGQRIATPFASNGNFLLNAVENLTGSTMLISIRSRAGFTRPFDRVEDLRRKADRVYIEREESLQLRLQETEAKLTKLQQQRDSNEANILTPEQEATLSNFQRDALDTRKQLREVRRNLTEDIDSLGTRLKFINILLSPILLTLLALLVALYRRQQKPDKTPRTPQAASS